MQLSREVLDRGQGVAVGNGAGVETAIIAAGAPAAILLGHHVQRRRPGGVGAANDASCLELPELGLGDAQLVAVQATRLGKNRRASCRDKVSHPVLGPRGPGTVADDGRKFTQYVTNNR